MDWARILAYVSGTVDQELLARIEYLAAENRILKAQLKGRLKLSDAERATRLMPIAELGNATGLVHALTGLYHLSSPGWISWADLGSGTHTARALSASITRAGIWWEVL